MRSGAFDDIYGDLDDEERGWLLLQAFIRGDREDQAQLIRTSPLVASAPRFDFRRWFLTVNSIVEATMGHIKMRAGMFYGLLLAGIPVEYLLEAAMSQKGSGDKRDPAFVSYTTLRQIGAVWLGFDRFARSGGTQTPVRSLG